MKTHKRTEAEKYISLLMAWGKPFWLEKTNGSVTVRTAKGHTRKFSQHNLTAGELGFVRKVTNEIKKNYTPKDLKRPKYIKNSMFFHEGPLVQIDINSAYWNSAKALGLISQKTYNEGKLVRKIVRLIAVGSIARTKMTYFFDGKKIERVGEEQNEERNAFFEIAEHTDSVMSSIFETGHVLFYWVDAFFVLPENAEHICLLLESVGLEYKKKKIKEFYTEKARNYIRYFLLEEGKEVFSPYTFPINGVEGLLESRKKILDEARKKGLYL